MKVKFNFLILLFVAAVTSCASGDALEVVSCGPYSSYGNDSWDPDSTDPNDRNPMVYYQDSSQVLEAFVSDPLAIGFHTDCIDTAQDGFLLLNSIKQQFPSHVNAIFDASDYIRAADSVVNIAVPDIANRPDIEDAIIYALSNGVSVNIVVDNYFFNANSTVYSNLEIAGAVIVTDGNDLNTLMNSKYMVIDGDEVIVSSGNFLSNSFFSMSNYSMRIQNTTLADCFNEDFDQMFENNQFQAQKESSASHCDNIIVDNRYGIDVFFGPHNGQLRNQMLNLINDVDFSLSWANSRIDDQILANALKSAESSFFSTGVLNGSDEQGGQQALGFTIQCFTNEDCEHSFQSSAIAFDFLAGSGGALGNIPVRGQNLRYFIGDAGSSTSTAFTVLTSANLTNNGLTANDEFMIVIRDRELTNFASAMHARALTATDLFDADGAFVEPALVKVTGTAEIKNPDAPIGDNMPESVTVRVISQGLLAFNEEEECSEITYTSGLDAYCAFEFYAPIGGFLTVQVEASGYRAQDERIVVLSPGTWDTGNFRLYPENGFASADGGGS